MNYLKLQIFEFLALQFYKAERRAGRWDDWAKSKASKRLNGGIKEIGFFDHLALIFYRIKNRMEKASNWADRKAVFYLNKIGKRF
jgi:hypothetical protein